MSKKKNTHPSIKTTSFPAKSEIARYVPPQLIAKGNRVSSAAFLPNPSEDYLSVNSTDIESLQTIAEHYRNDLQKDKKKVAIACRKIYAYNKGARKAGVTVKWDKKAGSWLFLDNNIPFPAYKLRPTKLSNSHSGVEFVRAFQNEILKKRYARRMAGDPPGKLHLQ